MTTDPPSPHFPTPPSEAASRAIEASPQADRTALPDRGSAAPVSPSHPFASSVVRGAKWTFWLVLLGAAFATAFALWQVDWGGTSGAAADDALTYTVDRITLRDTIVERGTLESQSMVNGVCLLNGYRNKITFIVEEGAAVEAGDKVVEFDTSEIEKEIAAQRIKVTSAEKAVTEAIQQIEVQKNTNESDIAAAKLEKTLADLDLEKYRDGDYIAELADAERSIAESEAALAQYEDQLRNTKVLVKKGFREPEQLRQLERQVSSARFQVERDLQRKEILEKYQHKRQITELQSRANEAARKLERAVANARSELTKVESELERAKRQLEIEREELEDLEQQLEHGVILAPHGGTVAYANERFMDPEYKIRAGGTVYRNQVVFYLPDLAHMQVNLEIHESVINKIALGQPARIRVDSYPDVELPGKVTKISDLARSDYGVQVKTYPCIVKIDAISEGVRLKPGMTAEVEVLTRTLKDVMAIPVQAVTQHMGLDFVFVKNGKNFERRMIKSREGNESFLIVEDGLSAGDQVALDAYRRGLIEFATLPREEEERLKLIRTERIKATSPQSRGADENAPPASDSPGDAAGVDAFSGTRSDGGTDDTANDAADDVPDDAAESGPESQAESGAESGGETDDEHPEEPSPQTSGAAQTPSEGG